MKQFFKMVFASCLGVILASGLVMLLFFTLLGSVISSSVDKFGKEKEAVYTVKPQSVLEIAPKGAVADTKSSSKFDLFTLLSSDSGQKQYSLGEIKEAIKKAKDNDNIEAIRLDLKGVSFGYATAQELRAVLEDFKDSGKPIFMYADNIFSLVDYYLATVADKIYLNPEGFLPINGIASQNMFYTGTLEKLGIEMQIFKVGTFKGAVEPFLRKDLSEPNREQISSYVNGLWEQMANTICTARNITRESLDDFINSGKFMSSGEAALQYGLVDSLMYGLDFKPMLAERFTGEFDADDYRAVSIDQMLRTKTKKSKSKRGDAIGLVIAEGQIVDTSLPIPSPIGAASSHVIDMGLAKKLRQLADDDDVKAVVMRVNSPGGSAYISEQIWKEVNDLKKKKPIVVSMGNYAASGGYYISCAANKIFADPGTLTGSIGIFGMFPNLEGAADKIGLKQDVVKTHQLADFGSTFRPMTEEEKAIMQANVEHGYYLFITRVADGRGMTKQQVDSIGQGRVWLGSQALERGLVDRLGSLEDAIDEAARLAELDHFFIYEPKDDKDDLFKRLLDSFSSVKANAFYSILSPQEKQLLEVVRRAEAQTGIFAMPYEDITQVR